MKMMTISIAVVMALTLGFGLAYAIDDEMPVFGKSKDVGTQLYEASLKHDAGIGIGSAAGGLRSEAAEYTSDTMPTFNSHRDIGFDVRDAKLKFEGVKGSAAGGERKEVSRADEYTSDTVPVLGQKR